MVSSSVSTGYVMSIFGFYIVLGVLLGLIGSAFVPQNAISSESEGPSVSGILDAISFFFQGIGYSITNFPTWANVLLFGPLTITVLYILTVLILDLIPG